jgi:cytochrome c peroxidase
MRGLAARAPYFHDGSAATLEEVARFYNTRFSMNLTEENITDLANFMRAL